MNAFNTKHLFLKLLVLLSTAWLAQATLAQADNCKFRGDLEYLYCDDNKDLVADYPTDPKKFKDPKTIVFTYTPVEDPAVYENAFKPFTNHLAQCTKRKVVFYQVHSNAAEIEAMRSGRLHVGGFSTGPTAFAVNLAGAIPFAMKGDAKGPRGYNLILIVKKTSALMKPADLKGKKVAHVSPSSNSGHLAPMALFPAQGLTPDVDYKLLFSGKHDQSILGVRSGDYDAAAVASDVFDRMLERGTIKVDDFRIIYRSQIFPTSSFALAHDLAPALREKMKECFFNFKFTPEMTKTFNGDDRFVPINYKTDWESVRKVDSAAGLGGFGRDAYSKMQKTEEAAAAAKKK